MNFKVIYYDAFGTAMDIKEVQAEAKALGILLDGEPAKLSERKVMPLVEDLDLLNDDDIIPQTLMQ
jgi:hypothetical protein